MSGPSDSPVVSLPVSRGVRYCTHCKTETKHTSRRCVSPAGKRLMWLIPLIIAAPCVHSLLGHMPTHRIIVVVYWVLPFIISVILVLMAINRHAFDVHCEQCGTDTLRLAPPRWTGQAPRRTGASS